MQFAVAVVVLPVVVEIGKRERVLLIDFPVQSHGIARLFEVHAFGKVVAELHRDERVYGAAGNVIVEGKARAQIVAAFFGMNTGVPWEGSMTGFYIAIGIALGGSLITALILWVKKMF